MKYYIIASGQVVDTPWYVCSPDDTKCIVKTKSKPQPCIKSLTAAKARTQAAEWSPDLESNDE
jgi:ribosomal protein S4